MLFSQKKILTATSLLLQLERKLTINLHPPTLKVFWDPPVPVKLTLPTYGNMAFSVTATREVRNAHTTTKVLLFFEVVELEGGGD